MYASEEWTVREAGEADAAALALVGAATFLETYAGAVDGAALVAHCAQKHSPEAYRAWLAGGARAWLAELAPGGAPIGYALAAEPTLDVARPGDWELVRIYVLSRFHRRGIAARLTEAATAAGAGRKRLLLGVKNDNTRALAFYQAQGFEQIGTRTFEVGGRTYDDFVLARALA